MASISPAPADVRPVSNAETIVTTRAVTKHYGAVHAVDGVTLDISRGELFGLIGHDGAGKSTLDIQFPRDLLSTGIQISPVGGADEILDYLKG